MDGSKAYLKTAILCITLATGLAAAETGTISWFDSQKGNGAIRATDSGKTFLFDVSKAPRPWPFKEGQKVVFLIGMGARGPIATNVQGKK